MKRAVIAIDPSMTNTGVSVWLVEKVPARVVEGLIVGGTAKPRCLLAVSSPYRKRDGFAALQQAIVAELDHALVSEWIGVVERPPHARHGVRSAPLEAEHRWIEWLEALARSRAEAFGVRYLRPTIVRPDPTMWRAPIGLPTKGLGATPLERRAWLKIKAKSRVVIEATQRQCAVLLEASVDDDASEAALIGLWAVRCVVPFDRHVVKTRYRGRQSMRAEALKWAV